MMRQDEFRSNGRPTLGVEVELQLVDAETMALRSAISGILGDLPPAFEDSVKPEFMQCYVEINTDICRTVADVGEDLGRKIRAVERVADRRGVGLLWAATHPFSHWQDQEITPNARYYKLADLLQETVVRPVTFGLHVHVGVDSGDKAIRIGDRIQRDLPVLLALSANSPLWHGRLTGHHAHRIAVLEGFPTGGLMPPMKSWAEYTSLLDQMRSAGFIESPREIWWDVRPSAGNGTIEVRICDMPPTLSDVLGLTALIQCLVHSISQEIDEGVPTPDVHPLMIRQNRWRACRYGPDALLVDPLTNRAAPARKMAEAMIDRFQNVAEELGCRAELERVRWMTAFPNGSERQTALFEQTGNPADVARAFLERSRLEPRKTPRFVGASSA